jgi:hypothetical protein
MPQANYRFEISVAHFFVIVYVHEIVPTRFLVPTPAKRSAAIVSPIPGTTRDIVETCVVCGTGRAGSLIDERVFFIEPASQQRFLLFCSSTRGR